MQKSDSRISWIDNVRMFAMFCVVVGHSGRFMDCKLDFYESFNLFIVSFNMPLFVFISGITAKHKLFHIKDTKELCSYTTTLAWRIAVPCISFTLLTMACVYAAQQRIDRSIIAFICLFFFLFVANYFYSKKETKWGLIFAFATIPACFINRAVWFLPFLLQTMLTAAVSAYAANRRRHKALYFSFFFLILMYAQSFSSFYSTAEMALPFILGMAFSTEMLNLDKLVGWKYRMSILTMTVVGLYLFILIDKTEWQFYKTTWFDLLLSHQLWVFFVRQTVAVVISIGILLVFKDIFNKQSFLTRYGTMTLGIYALHGLIIYVLKEYIPPLSISSEIQLLIGYSVIPIIIFGITILLLCKFTRIRLFNVLFMGIK